MYPQILRPAWMEIDLKRLDSNIKAIKRRIGNSKLIGIVKSDAYGHGSRPVSEILIKNGAAYLAVATVEEALELRQWGFDCPIMMLGLVPDRYCEPLVENDIIPLVSAYENAKAISRLAERLGKTVSIFIAADTGMGRIGFLNTPEEALEVKKISELPGIYIEGMMSHFSSADMEDLTYTYRQMEQFDAFYNRISALGVSVPVRTLANSPAVMRLPQSFYEAVRPGTLIWGCYPDYVEDKSAVSLEPVMSIKADIVHIKTVPPGTAISYGRLFTTGRESVIATIPVGYADGYTRLLRGCARVLIHGCFAPVLGTICMDQFMVDVTDIPGVRLGDEAVLLGSQGGQTISIEELAGITGLCSGELFYGFSQRLPRICVFE